MLGIVAIALVVCGRRKLGLVTIAVRQALIPGRANCARDATARNLGDVVLSESARLGKSAEMLDCVLTSVAKVCVGAVCRC